MILTHTGARSDDNDRRWTRQSTSALGSPQKSAARPKPLVKRTPLNDKTRYENLTIKMNCLWCLYATLVSNWRGANQQNKLKCWNCYSCPTNSVFDSLKLIKGRFSMVLRRWRWIGKIWGFHKNINFVKILKNIHF